MTSSCAIVAVTVLLGVSGGVTSQRPTDKAQAYTFGVVPQQSASMLAKVWVPFLKKISKDSGVHFRFKTARDIPTFERECAKGTHDFA